MAKYEITHSCNHVETVTLFGPGKDRDRKIEWLGSLPCAACASIDQIKSAADIHELQQAAGLPRLLGSEKQVAWAVTIRQTFLVAWKKIERRLTEAAMTETASAKLAEALLFEGDAYVETPLSNADAKYWIDNRNKLDESALNSHLYEIRHQIAEQAQAIVTDSLPITDDDKKEVIRMALEARQAALEERRMAESTRRAEIAQAAQKLQQERASRDWDRKDKLAAAVHAAIGDISATIATYYKDNEKRIYLDSGRKKACLYVTGSAKKRPGSIDEAFGMPFLCDQQLLRIALEMCSRDWRNIKMEISAAGKAL